MEIFSKESKQFTVLSLFTGICGMDLGFGGEVIVHKNSIFDDYSSNVSCTSYIPGFVKQKRKNFEVAFQNDIFEGAKNICDLNRISHNYTIRSIYDILTDVFVFPTAEIVIGGFPCNDFSHAGKRLGFNSSTTHNLKDDITDGNSRGTL